MYHLLTLLKNLKLEKKKKKSILSLIHSMMLTHVVKYIHVLRCVRSNCLGNMGPSGQRTEIKRNEHWSRFGDKQPGQ